MAFTSLPRRLVALTLASSLALGGCSLRLTNEQVATEAAITQAASSISSTYVNLIDTTQLLSDRDLDPSYESMEVTATIALADDASTAVGSGLTIDGNTITINQEGIYVFSGTLSDGQIVVNANGKVQIVLNGVSIVNDNDACIWISQASHTYLTLADGTQNYLATSGSFAGTDATVDATVFSEDGLTINGEGSLSVSCSYGNGVVSKDEMALVSGTVDVWANDNAVESNDWIAVAGGAYTLTCGGDGLHVSNSDTSQGNLYVKDGSVTVTEANDGIHVSGKVQVDGGEVTLTVSDDAVHAEQEFAINGGSLSVPSSHEGIEASSVFVTGGETNLVGADDGINATGTLSAAKDEDLGTSAAETVAVAATEVGELTATVIEVGEQTLDAEADETAQIVISGGKLTVSSGGDGIDSNGTLVISGGEVYATGAENNLNAALDFGISGSVSGGTVMALGMGGAAEGFSADSTQASAIVYLPVAVTGEAMLANAAGEVVAGFSSDKAYDCVLVSSDELLVGESYTLVAGAATVTFTLTTTSNKVVAQL